jgi:hypothetical protein
MYWQLLGASALASMVGAWSCGVSREYDSVSDQPAGASGEGGGPGTSAEGGASSSAEGGAGSSAAGGAGASAEGGAGSDSEATPGTEAHCADGAVQVCGSDVGSCRQGLRLCVDGVWSAECKLETGPEPRDCASSADNDCDGTPDDASSSCNCVVGGEPRPCEGHLGYDGESGPCRAGSQECIFTDGHAATDWGACEGAVGPAEHDRCDVVGDDSDCSGTPNDGCDCATYHPDVDGDTYGAPGAGVKSCNGSPEPGYVTNGGDCCDLDELVHPGAGFGKIASKCQGWDLNCDKQVDEQVPSLPSSNSSVHYEWIGNPPSGCGNSGDVRACANSCPAGSLACCGNASALFVTCK